MRLRCCSQRLAEAGRDWVGLVRMERRHVDGLGEDKGIISPVERATQTSGVVDGPIKQAAGQTVVLWHLVPLLFSSLFGRQTSHCGALIGRATVQCLVLRGSASPERE